MFSRNHFIWLGISLLIVVFGLNRLVRKKVPFHVVLRACCILAFLSEYVKVFSSVKMLPMSTAAGYYPYLALGHLPFHLCSIQIFFIFYVTFARPSKTRDALLALMYPTCVAGAFLALLMPVIFPTSIDVSQAFTHPLAYQYFLWHCTLLIMGFYIPISGEVKLSLKNLGTTILLLEGITFLSIYVNSFCSSAIYADGKPIGLDYVTNFFFTMQIPIGLRINTKGQWILYYVIIHVIAVTILWLLYLPFLRRDGFLQKKQGKDA